MFAHTFANNAFSTLCLICPDYAAPPCRRPVRKSPVGNCRHLHCPWWVWRSWYRLRRPVVSCGPPWASTEPLHSGAFSVLAWINPKNVFAILNIFRLVSCQKMSEFSEYSNPKAFFLQQNTENFTQSRQLLRLVSLGKPTQISLPFAWELYEVIFFQYLLKRTLSERYFPWE